jgi:hypothetical protein
VVGVLLEEGIGCKLASLAAAGTEEIALDVIGDAGRFDGGENPFLRFWNRHSGAMPRQLLQSNAFSCA